VAARAGVPLAATTYYFASLEELVELAAVRLAESYLGPARAVADALPGIPPPTGGEQRVDPRAVAAVLVAVVAGDATVVEGGDATGDPA
jgi:DNA-binding transcriptional regulator YbjK